MHRFRQIVADFGWPRIIIFFFLVALFFAAPLVNVRVDASLSDVFNRFGQNAIFVLALVPMIQAGCGLNFGLSLGIIAGLLGATLSIAARACTGPSGFFGGHRPGVTLRGAVRLRSTASCSTRSRARR